MLLLQTVEKLSTYKINDRQIPQAKTAWSSIKHHILIIGRKSQLSLDKILLYYEIGLDLRNLTLEHTFYYKMNDRFKIVSMISLA